MTALSEIFFCIVICLCSICVVQGDALHPRRPHTEEEFLKLKHHERTMTEEEMIKKISQIKARRKWSSWDLQNPSVIHGLTKLYAHGNVAGHIDTVIDGKNGAESSLASSTKSILGLSSSTVTTTSPPVQNITDHLNTIREYSSRHRKRAPNILLILADDLGYGDLSVPPFILPKDPKETKDNVWPCAEGGILSPNLEIMAARGTIMTNFHSASPVCSPSRVAILTGLYPWRLGALNAFELGTDMSQRNGFLPQVPTIAEMLREMGYFTAHSGKWHLGGMREEMRNDRAYKDQCSRGSPNQHGFETYISELDGPESPRYTFLNRNSELHSKGHRHLLKDDVPMPMVDKPNGAENILSDREAEDAIAMITDITTKRPNQPWFLNVWFNAPHGPWELLKTGEQVYSVHHNKSTDFWEAAKCQPNNEKLRDQRRWQYKTMVTAMDRSIGLLLESIQNLGIEEDTLIIFTSDNGPEVGAGTGGIYKVELVSFFCFFTAFVISSLTMIFNL